MSLEIFDLFGEEIFCSVCLEPIEQGQRTVVVQNCQHGFHQPCIDPWLVTNKSCPNCRGSIELSAEQQTTQEPTAAQLIELDRIYLTYVLYTWIFFTFNGIRYKRHHIAIHQFLTNFQWNTRRPLPFTLNIRNRVSLSTIRSLRTYLMDREATLFQQMYPTARHRVIHKNPRVIQIRSQIRQQLDEFSREHLS